MQNNRRTVIVTGATGTIGKAICTSLISKGYYVVALTRNKERGKALANAVGSERFCYKLVDIAKVSEVEALFGDKLVEGCLLDGVVTCAGILEMGPSDQFATKAWDRTLQINTSGTFYIFRQAIKKMRLQQNGGVLIAIGSRWGNGAKEAAAYASSKAALKGLISSLQKELAGSDVRPILVSPGSVQSPMSTSVSSSIDKELLRPDDIAGLVAYILSTPSRVIFNEITMQAYAYDLTDEYAQ